MASLTFAECLEGLGHALALLLPLQPLAVLAANIASDGVEDALVPVVSRDPAELFEFEQVLNGVGFNLSEQLSVRRDEYCTAVAFDITDSLMSSRRYSALA